MVKLIIITYLTQYYIKNIIILAFMLLINIEGFNEILHVLFT